jgi:tetratricopeptide (TPR) repeat protein
MFDWEDESHEGHLNEEIERFERELSQDAVGFYDSDRFEGIIDHYLINGNYTKARIAAEMALNQYPFNSLFLIRKAQAMSGMGHLREALSTLAEAESMENNSLEIVLTKAAIFSQLRDSKRAVKYFREALALAEKEDKDEIYLDLASELSQLRNYSAAVEVLEEAMRQNPKNEGALYEIAFCFDQLGDYNRAVKSYTDFLDENPYSFTAWYNLGNTYSKQEKFADAVTAYEYCTAINENFSPAYFNMGNAFLTLEQFNESIEAFNTCISLDGEDALTYCYLGEAYEQLEKLDTAWDYYQKSIALSPTLAEAWLGLGIIKDLQEKPLEALAYIERAIELEPEMDGYHHVYAGALENCSRIEEAERAYLTCLALEPSNEDAYFDYVDFLLDFYPVRVRSFVEQYVLTNAVFFSILPVVYLNWMSDRMEEAKLILSECMLKDPVKTREIFVRYPELMNVPEFVNLTH